MVGNKHVFWQALVFTIIIFVIGLIFGFFIESYLAGQIEYSLAKSEINLLDEQVRIRAIGGFDIDCDKSKRGLFEFADRIYSEALKLEEQSSSSQFDKETFDLLHKRYDLLRTMLWVESNEIKELCGDNFHTLTYLYESETTNTGVRAKQLYFSRLLAEIKDEHPEDILLIPIAIDTGLSSLEMIIENYEITDFPVVVINGEIKVSEVVTKSEFEKIVFE
ncbi:hypothetical protein COU60_01720 [Candidatus Pacearchaeota archaeon CG10_big_fil_rev_8_21_14_0_10_34_76]|nr:MAG: hypothetical protein COU60_01720 [Candidatus Pacearchaeota archaeon CG10_big_fil_rev_8_21_14_0_10_34_76]